METARSTAVQYSRSKNEEEQIEILVTLVNVEHYHRKRRQSIHKRVTDFQDGRDHRCSRSRRRELKLDSLSSMGSRMSANGHKPHEPPLPA
jgi:hypothetical protein